jgi:hypothetical protein
MATKRDEQVADYRSEAIARPFADAAERSSTVSKTGEGQSGMRTERITLEVTHELDGLSDWIVKVVNESLGMMESVRVVHEPKLAPDANADGEANHAAQAASGGGVLARIAEAFGCDPDDDDDLVEAARLLVRERDQAVAKAASGGGEGEPYMVTASGIPLYRQPPQPRGWLTEEERKWIEYMMGNCVLPYAGMACMEAILARSSPPEVVLPLADLGDRLLRDGVIDALAAAGVAVKGVGK